jgi:hypothetical protein
MASKAAIEKTEFLPQEAVHPADEGGEAALADADIEQQIALAAYFKAEQRGFEPGYDIEDWLEAEREVRNSRSPFTH